MHSETVSRECIVTLERDPCTGIENCHILPLGLRVDRLGSLEYSWGLKKTEYDLNSPYNIAFMRPDLHAAFTQEQWALVPTKEIVDDIRTKSRMRIPPSGFYYEYASTEEAPKTYQYTFVPLPMQDAQITIFRRRWSNDNEGLQYDSYAPPYADFPVITSQVHPFCAIYDAGRKLAAVPSTGVPKAVYTICFHMLSIYARWIKPAPKGWRNDGPPTRPPSDNGNSHLIQDRSDVGPCIENSSGVPISFNHIRRRPLQRLGLRFPSILSVFDQSLQMLDDGEPFYVFGNVLAWLDGVEDLGSIRHQDTPLHNDKDVADYRSESESCRELGPFLQSNF